MSKGKFKMTQQAASRIQSAAAKNPGSKTSTTNFNSRAQSSGAKNTASGKSGTGGSKKKARLY